MTTACRFIHPIRSFGRLLLIITVALALNSPGLASPSSSGGTSGGRAASASAPAPQPQFVYVGNHDSKDLSVFHVNAATGELSPVAGSPFRLETTPTSVVASPNGEFIFVAGDSSAGIFAYKIDSRGAPQAVEGSPFETSASPHQLVVDHSGNHLYATVEESGTVLAFAIDAASGKLTAIAGSPFSAGRAASAIAISPDDHFLFVSSAAENVISSLGLNERDGTLAPTRNSAVETGFFPERIAISASGKELYVSNAGSDSVSAFAVDTADGALTPAIGSPFETLHSPGDLVVTPDSTRLLVASSQAAGLSGMSIHLEGTTAAGESLLAPASPIAPRGSLTLAGDVAGQFLFTVNADSNTITRYLVDPKTHNLSVGSGLSYATGSRPRALAVANTAPPQTTESISVALASGSLLTFASTTGTVTLSAAAVQGSDSSCAGQVIQLAFSVPSIGVISTATENPATSVCVLTGETTASFTVTTSTSSGSATLTAFATGFTDGTTSLSVTLRTITLTLPYTNIGTGNTVTGTVKLANPAPSIPSPGGVTISLASSAAATASIAPASVSIAAGATTASFTVTGVQANTATLTASVPTGGYSNGTLGVTVFPPGLTISLPHNAVVAPGQSLPYPVSIGAPATINLSVTLAGSGGPGTVTFTPNPVMIPIGQTSPTTAPTINGVNIGPLSVTGRATGYASDTENATVQITLTFNPNTLSVEAGTTKDLTLSASAVAPAPNGFKITLASANPLEASVGPNITIPAGSSSVSVPITGVAAGTTTVQATAPGAIAGSAAITVYSPPGITLYGPEGGGSFTIGYNGVVGLSGILAEAAPAGNLVVKLVTPATSNLLLSKTATTGGSHSITVTVPAGSTSIPTFYALAKASSGNTTITATAPAYSNGTATATFVPSGFILEGGTSTTSLSGTSPVYVYLAQLDPTTLAYTGQTLTLRAGAPAVTLHLSNTDTPAGVGTLGSSSVVFKANDTHVQTTFKPAAAGSAVIGFASTPAGYATPASNTTTTFTVTEPNSSLILCNIYSITGTGAGSIGYNSACASSVSLATAAPLGGRKVTLTSNSANLLLSASATTVGSSSITLTVAAGSTTAPQFYAQALASTGSATITETVPGYNSTTATVNFVPSGFIVLGGTTTTTFSGTSPVYVYFAQLDPTTLAYTGQTLILRPGASTATIGLTNADTPAGVGTLGSSSLVFKAGDTNHQTTFQPAVAGSAVIGFSGTLAGYSTPSTNFTTTFTVTAPNSSLILCNIYSITGTGKGSMAYNSACASSISLAVAAPTGGRPVTLTSNSANLLLSTSATTVGSASITLNVPAGSTTAPQFYAQALASTGSATITETVSGYNSTTATVNFVPSGFIALGGTSTTTFSGTSPVYVYFAQLDPTTLAYTGQTLILRPGASTATVGLTNTDTPAGVGTLGASAVTFNAGDTSHQTTFQPVSPGSAVIGFNSTLAGYSTPSTNATTTFTVTAPNTSLIFCNIYSITGTGTGSIAYNSACASSVSLATAAPAGGRTVNLTSSDPTKLLLSTSATTVGSGSITLTVAAGSTTAPQFYAQALVSTGTVTVTESVSGYNPTAATVNFVPSGFILQGGTTTTTFSGTSPVYVYFAQLDPTTLSYTGQTLTLRPGAAAATIGLTNTDTPAGVGTLGSNSLVFNPGDTSHQTTFQPAVAGTAVIGFSSTLAGYSKPSNFNTTTFTVTAPNSSLILCNIYSVTGTGSGSMAYNSACASSISLAVAAPAGGRTVTLTSNSANLLLSTSATTVGLASITLSVAAGSTTAPQFYAQALASTGSATITETVPGYNPTTATVNFVPSGFIVVGGTSTTSLSGTSPVYVYFAQLDPSTLAYEGQTLILRPGAPAATIGLTNTDTPAGVGTLASNSLVFNPGDTSHQTTFQPAVAGSAVIGFSSTLAGYATPSTNATTTFTVTTPTSSVLAVTVGNYMETTTNGTLQVGAPSGGVTVTISAPSTAKILLSTSASVKGNTSISFTLAANSSSTPIFYVQSQGGGAGTVTLTISAPGYANGTGTVTVYPSGFALQGSNFTTTLTDNPTTLTIVPAALDPTFLNIYQVQELVPNVTTLLAPVTPTGTLVLTVQSGTAPVGMFSLNSVTFKGDDNPNFLTSSFVPESVGTALITITSPAGFSNASTEITATVTQ
jgi:6-phosphogluconolactonase (cycloisomerase 2 family)